jgi:hydroxymethylbilane synthase
MRQIVVGTRGSLLALAQARWVVARLKEEWPDTEFKLQTIHPKPGKDSAGLDPRLLLVQDLRAALADNRIHIALHNLKDVPTAPAEGLEVAAITKRLETRVALVGRAGCKSLETLPQGARVGVSSPLRTALLRAYRPDVIVRELRGEVDARLEALTTQEYDAILLAASDLVQLELRNRIDDLIAPDIIMPTPGQGVMALEVRADDDMAAECAYGIHHHASDDRITAERAFLNGLGDDPRAPIGALAVIGDDGVLTLEGCVADPDGQNVIRASIEGDPDEAEDLGAELAEDVLAQGGAALLKKAGVVPTAK